MQEMLKKIITDVLISIYTPFGFALISAYMLTIVYMYCYEPKDVGKGFEAMLCIWLEKFKKNKHFRELFFFFLFSVIILFKTLFIRNIWANPLSNIMGGWSFTDPNGNMTLEPVENVIMLIPWTWLMIVLKNRKNAVKRPVLYAMATGFLFSLTIETLQLMLRLGTFQLSDICYNTLGGMIGGVMYYVKQQIKNIVNK